MKLFTFAILFGWYDSPIGTPLNHIEQIQNQSHYASMTMTGRYWVELDWQVAKAAGIKVVTQLPHEFRIVIDEGRPLILNTPMWCRMPDISKNDPGWCNKTAADWINLMLAHRDQIEVIEICDECDCNYGGHGINFWSSSSCDRMARKLEAIIADVRYWLPGVKTWVGYSAPWIGYFVNPYNNQLPREPMNGVRLASSDWIGFNCYRPWNDCFARASVPQMVNGIKAKMNASQSVVLIPRAFGGTYLNYNPAPEEVVVGLYQYLNYAKMESRIAAIMPFIPFNIHGPGTGGIFIPQIHEAVKQIGRLLTKPVAAPTNLRIVRE